MNATALPTAASAPPASPAASLAPAARRRDPLSPGLLALAFLLAVTASGCSRFRVKPVHLYEDDPMRLHVVLIDNEGRPVFPTTIASDRRVLNDDQYNRYLNNIEQNLMKYVEKQRAMQRQPRVVVFVHGGLNGFDDTVIRYQQTAKSICEDGAFPLFIGWNSGLLSTYVEDLIFVRQGETTSWIGALLTPFYLCADFGTALLKLPINAATSIWTDIQASDFADIPLLDKDEPEWYQIASHFRLKPRSGISAAAIYKRYLLEYPHHPKLDRTEQGDESYIRSGLRSLGLEDLPGETSMTLTQWGRDYLSTYGGLPIAYKERAEAFMRRTRGRPEGVPGISPLEGWFGLPIYLATLPIKLATLWPIDAVGDRAWRNMRRRTIALFYPPRQLDPWDVLNQPAHMDKRLGLAEFSLVSARRIGVADDDLSDGALSLLIERLRRATAQGVGEEQYRTKEHEEKGAELQRLAIDIGNDMYALEKIKLQRDSYLKHRAHRLAGAPSHKSPLNPEEDGALSAISQRVWRVNNRLRGIETWSSTQSVGYDLMGLESVRRKHLRDAPGGVRIDLIGHSMGCIIINHMLHYESLRLANAPGEPRSGVEDIRTTLEALVGLASRSLSQYGVSLGQWSKGFDSEPPGEVSPFDRKYYKTRSQLASLIDRYDAARFQLAECSKRLDKFRYRERARRYANSEQLPIKNIVYLGAACSIRDWAHAVLPHLDKHDDVRFYNLSLHPISEVRERAWSFPVPVFDLPPRGSLLVWVDNHFTDPELPLDRTMGRWDNIMRATHIIPLDVRGRVTLKAFALGGQGFGFEEFYGAFWRTYDRLNDTLMFGWLIPDVEFETDELTCDCASEDDRNGEGSRPTVARSQESNALGEPRYGRRGKAETIRKKPRLEWHPQTHGNLSLSPFWKQEFWEVNERDLKEQVRLLTGRRPK